MKRLLLAALIFGLTWVARAQNVPEHVSFQGRVVDAQGTNLGSPNPVNRTVIFRIYDGTSNSAALKYTEQQNVTIINGEFSVLIGQGTAYGSESKPVLSSVFDGLDRYLGVTVKDPAIALDTNQKEIVPRQRFVATPFAFRAKVAESVAAGGIANGQITTAQLAGTATVVAGVPTLTTLAGAVTVEKLADNAVTSAKILDGQVMETDLANNAVTSAKISDLTIVTADLAGQDAATAGNAQIVAGAVSTAKIQNGAVTAAKLHSSALLGVTAGGLNATIDSNLNGKQLFLNGSLYGLGNDSAFGVDGPTLYGLGGGALGVNNTNQTPAKRPILTWAPAGVTVNGNISSPRFKVTEVCAYNNGDWTSSRDVARKGVYVSSGGTLLVTVIGSGHRAESTPMEACLKLTDSAGNLFPGTGPAAGVVKAGVLNYRITLTRQFILKPPAGTYDLYWGQADSNPPTTNSGDFSQVTVMELPF